VGAVQSEKPVKKFTLVVVGENINKGMKKIVNPKS
jgi:hypothetical protein